MKLSAHEIEYGETIDAKDGRVIHVDYDKKKIIAVTVEKEPREY